MPQESTERFNPSKEWPLITHGLPYPEAIARHLTQTLHCKRPFLIISRSLSRNPEIVERLQEALGKEDGNAKIAGVRPGMLPHTYYSEILEISRKVNETAADSIVTIGGGSLVDGAKAISLALANKATTHEALDTLLRASNTLRRPQGAPPPETTVHLPTLPIISVPTTLSAGDFNAGGGATNDQTKYKQSFYPPNGRGGISVIVLDPSLTTTAPERVWLSTGMRAVDHCVETICSSNPNEEGTKSSLRGIRRLIPGLLRTRRDAGDLEARLECLLGAGDSMRASILHGVHVGGSHGIGHQLGPMGVPHAETTCICLPAVQKYNATHALASSSSSSSSSTTSPSTAATVQAQQAIVLDALWAQPDIADTLTRRGLVREQADLGDALDAVIRELGLPRTLDEYGIGRAQFERIAEQSLKDVCCQWNAVPLERREQIWEILEMCLGGQ